MWKKIKKFHCDRFNGFNSRSAITERKEPKKAKNKPRKPQNDFMEDNDFVENEVVTPKLKDAERREFNPQGNNSQIKTNTEIGIERVKEELFETALDGSTKESITTNTNNRSRSTKIPTPKVATEQKRDSLLLTTERSEGEVFPKRSTASTSQNVTERRYQTRSASWITRSRKLRDYFLFKYKDSEEKFDNDVFFEQVIQQNAEHPHCNVQMNWKLLQLVSILSLSQSLDIVGMNLRVFCRRKTLPWQNWPKAKHHISRRSREAKEDSSTLKTAWLN